MNNIVKAAAFEVRLPAGYQESLARSQHLFEEFDWQMLEYNLDRIAIRFVLMEVEIGSQAAKTVLVATTHCESTGCYQAAAADEGQMTVRGELMPAEKYLAWYQSVIRNPVLIDQQQLAGITFKLYRHERSLPEEARAELSKFGAEFEAVPNDTYVGAPDRIVESYQGATVPIEVLSAILYGACADRIFRLEDFLKHNNNNNFHLEGLTTIDALIAGKPAPLGSQSELF